MASGVKEDCGRERENEYLVFAEKRGEVVHVGRVKRLRGRVLQVLADVRTQLLGIRTREKRYCLEGMASDAIDKHCQRCLLVLGQGQRVNKLVEGQRARSERQRIKRLIGTCIELRTVWTTNCASIWSSRLLKN